LCSALDRRSQRVFEGDNVEGYTNQGSSDFRLHRGTLICGAALALACSNPYQTYASADNVPVTSVKVTPQSIVLVAIGQTQDVKATIVPANATDQIVAWESADPAVVSVDANGRVTAKAVGSGVIITAITHDGHYQSSTNVSVNP
jgi:uncharacterized protein YjdB